MPVTRVSYKVAHFPFNFFFMALENRVPFVHLQVDFSGGRELRLVVRLPEKGTWSLDHFYLIVCRQLFTKLFGSFSGHARSKSKVQQDSRIRGSGELRIWGSGIGNKEARLQCNLPDCIHHRVAAMLMIWGTCVTCANLATRTHTEIAFVFIYIYCFFVPFLEQFSGLLGLHLLIAKNGDPEANPQLGRPCN